MQSLNHQLYALIVEAMHANKLTASDISQVSGHHYTYIYNTVRKNANVTLDTAEKLANACGYDVQITFTPKGAQQPLTGKMDPGSKLYSSRRKKVAETAPVAEVAPAMSKAEQEEAELDAEIEALLDSVDA